MSDEINNNEVNLNHSTTLNTIADKVGQSFKIYEQCSRFDDIVSQAIDQSSLDTINLFFEKQASIVAALRKTNYIDTAEKIAKLVQQPDYLAGLEASRRLVEKLTSIPNFESYVLKIQSLFEMHRAYLDKFSSVLKPDIDIDALLKLRIEWGKYGWTYLFKFPCKYIKQYPSSQEEADKLASDFWDDTSLLLDEFKCSDFSECDWQSFQEMAFAYSNNQFKTCCMLLVSLIESFLYNYQRNLKNLPQNKLYVIRPKRIGLIKDFVLEEYREQDGYYEVCAYLWVTNLFEAINQLFSSSEDFKSKMFCINRNYLQHGMCNRLINKIDCVKLLLIFYNLKYCLNVISAVCPQTIE